MAARHRAIRSDRLERNNAAVVPARVLAGGIESKNVTGQWMPRNASSLDCYLREAPDRTTIRLRVVEASAKAKEFATLIRRQSFRRYTT